MRGRVQIPLRGFRISCVEAISPQSDEFFGTPKRARNFAGSTTYLRQWCNTVLSRNRHLPAQTTHMLLLVNLRTWTVPWSTHLDSALVMTCC